MQDSLNGSSKSNGRWTKYEHDKFLEGLRIYGKNWKKIQAFVQTRSGCQIRSHAQKFFLKTKSLETSESNESSSVIREFIDCFPEQTNIESKKSQEWQASREDLSYYVHKILEHSVGRGKLDFWSMLVDCKQITDNLNLQSRHSSLVSFQKVDVFRGGQDSLNNKVVI